MNHSFDVDIATKYGIEEAILITNLEFWIKKNKANKKNFFDGRYWTYNSVSAFEELFPYMTTRKIRTALESLIKQGLLLTGNFNENKYDRTKWYAFTDFGETLLNMRQIDLSKTTNDYTDINTNIIDNVSESDVSDVCDYSTETSLTNFVTTYFMDYAYPWYTQRNHPIIKNEQADSIMINIGEFTDENNVDKETWIKMIDEYFKDKNLVCDHNLNHFATEEIMMNRWKKVT